jgi:hypothetical protein
MKSTTAFATSIHVEVACEGQTHHPPGQRSARSLRSVNKGLYDFLGLEASTFRGIATTKSVRFKRRLYRAFADQRFGSSR